MPRRLLALATAALLSLATVGCEGGDVSPEDAGGGGVPPRVDAPRENIGQSEGFPDEFPGEAHPENTVAP